MSDDISTVPILLRREIEALITVPLIEAFAEEFGEEKTLQIARKVITQLAEENGRQMAGMLGGNEFSDIQTLIGMFGNSGALEVEDAGETETSLKFNVVRCKYAERYRELGIDKYGTLLSCARDESLFKGFNPEFKFIRTQTIMEGKAYCDFCLERT